MERSALQRPGHACLQGRTVKYSLVGTVMALREKNKFEENRISDSGRRHL